MPQALRRHWFLLLLVATLVVGMVGAGGLSDFAHGLPRNWIIGSVLLAMTLPMQWSSITRALTSPQATILCVAVNWLLVPALAWGASLLLQDDLALGLIIAAAVPCTLASATVWTRLAGGNEAISLLVTVVTNLSCFLVTPALIQLFAGNVDITIPFGEMALKLFLLIVLPILAAQALRRLPNVAHWASEKKPLLSVYSQVGLLAIVFIGAVECGIKMDELGGEISSMAGQLTLLLVLVAAVHTAAWYAGFWTAGLLGICRSDQIAVAFAGSQKTLMVGLAIALQFGGLAILPMLAYHIEQLLIDTLLAERLRAAKPQA